MVERHRYAALGARHRTRYQPPSRLDFARWQRWAWETLGIYVHIEAVDPCVLAVAQLVEAGPIRGCITISDQVEEPLWLLCHEIGHLMTRQTHSIELIDDERTWQRVPAEVAATEYALGFLIDEHELMDWLADGGDVAGAAQRWCVPTSAIEWRLRLLGVRVG